MHQTAKGKQWYFGMKAHIGVDSKEKIIPHRKSLRKRMWLIPWRCRICCTEKRLGCTRPGVTAVKGM